MAKGSSQTELITKIAKNKRKKQTSAGSFQLNRDTRIATAPAAILFSFGESNKETVTRENGLEAISTGRRENEFVQQGRLQSLWARTWSL